MNGYPQYNDWRTMRVVGTGKLGQTFEIMRNDGFGAAEQGALKVIRVPAEDTVDAQHAQRARLESAAQTLRAADALKEHPNILPWLDHTIRPAENGDGWEILLRSDMAVLNF